jgi:hypothetical protein
MTGFVQIRFDSKIYSIVPEITIIADIEDELFGVALLLHKFSHQEWKVSELVTVVQMLLQSAGQTVDYRLLGNWIIAEGLEPYLVAVIDFLGLVLGKGA